MNVKHTDWSVDIGVEATAARCIFQVEAHHWGSEQHSLVRCVFQMIFLPDYLFINIFIHSHESEPTQPKKIRWFYRRYWGMCVLQARYMAFALRWSHLLNCMPIPTPWSIMRSLPNDCGVMFTFNRKRKNSNIPFACTSDPLLSSFIAWLLLDGNLRRNHHTIQLSAVLLNSYLSHCTSCWLK